MENQTSEEPPAVFLLKEKEGEQSSHSTEEKYFESENQTIQKSVF